MEFKLKILRMLLIIVLAFAGFLACVIFLPFLRKRPPEQEYVRSEAYIEKKMNDVTIGESCFHFRQVEQVPDGNEAFFERYHSCAERIAGDGDAEAGAIFAQYVAIDASDENFGGKRYYLDDSGNVTGASFSYYYEYATEDNDFSDDTIEVYISDEPLAAYDGLLPEAEETDFRNIYGIYDNRLYYMEGNEQMDLFQTKICTVVSDGSKYYYFYDALGDSYWENHLESYCRVLSEMMDQPQKTDDLVLSVGIGNGEGEIGYSDSMAGGGSGPEAFTVAEDGRIYICDNVNKRVNVYQNGSFSYTIDTPYITYVRSIVESDGFIYLMDYDAGTIYAADTDGTLVRAVSLPDSMKSYLMKKLYIQSDGTVCLFYERNLLNSENAGVDCTYFLDDLEAGRAIGAEGFIKDTDHAYRIINNTLNVSSLNTDIAMTSEIDHKSTQIMPDNSLTSMRILNVDDKDIVYISVYDMVDSSIVSGEYTVRKFTDGTCTGIAPIDLKPYYYMPNNVLEVSENGKLYQMICTKDQVLIVEKAFVDSDDFKSDKSRIEAEALEKEAALESVSAQ